MRSTVWVVDQALGRPRADAIAAELAARGVRTSVLDFADGPAVVVDDPPAGLARPEGVVREASVDLPADGHVTRRALLERFAGLLVVATAAAAVGAVAAFASPPPGRREDQDEIDAASFAELKS